VPYRKVIGLIECMTL